MSQGEKIMPHQRIKMRKQTRRLFYLSWREGWRERRKEGKREWVDLRKCARFQDHNETQKALTISYHY